MRFGRITVVGDGGLLGEIVAREFARHGEVTALPNNRALAEAFGPVPDVVAVWAEALEIGATRQQLRGLLPEGANPILLFLSQLDPHVYFTRLRDMHVDRRRMGFSDVFDAIASQLTGGSTTTDPVRAGLV